MSSKIINILLTLLLFTSYSLATAPAEKIIYLTFDDGPLYGTKNVLNILETEDVEATMFFVGRHVKMNKRIFEYSKAFSNVTIANHTYSHADGSYAKFYRNGKKLVDDINKAQNIMCDTKYQRLAGRNVWRMPELKRDDYAIKKKRRTRESKAYDMVYDAGYYIYGWDVEWRFDHRTHRAIETPYKMFKRIKYANRKNRTRKPGKVVLLAHDYMFKDRVGGGKNLIKLIRLLKNDGWSFETIETYANSRPDNFNNIPIKEDIREMKEHKEKRKSEEKSCNREEKVKSLSQLDKIKYKSLENNVDLKNQFLDYFDNEISQEESEPESIESYEEEPEAIEEF